MPRRDWILLPLVAVVTMSIMVATTEVIARRMFPITRTEITGCLINDPTTGVRARPNSVCWEKLPETPLTEYKFNRCGHRAGEECGAKPAGTYRIVLVGSSIAMGQRIPREDGLAALLPPLLSEETGRTVDVYNEGMSYGTPHSVLLRFKEVAPEQPDMVLWIITSRDVENASELVPPPEENKPQSLIKTILHNAQSSRTAVLLLYYLYKSPTSYAKVHLIGAGAPGFLRSNLGLDWQAHLREFDSYAAQIEAQSKAEGIPFVATFAPSRAHAAMLSMSEEPAGFNPYKLDAEVRRIIESHGGTYLDILPGFKSIPNSEQHYFPMDGHPDAEGHQILTRLLAQQLINGSIPALKSNGAATITGKVQGQ